MARLARGEHNRTIQLDKETIMFGLGTTELIIILVLVMIVFGAGKLPQVASSLGKGVRNLKDGVDPNLIDDEEMADKGNKEP
jgi:sec-independent protein translocase protein TatA